MSPPRNTLAGLLADHYPTQRNALLDFAPANPLSPQTLGNALMNRDPRPKSEWVSGYYHWVPNGLLGHRYEWVPGYWRRRAW